MAVKKPAPKRKKDREATIALISNAALSIFSKVGFDKATTKAISEKAGVAEALIIRYFGTKKGLLIALTKQYILEMEAEGISYPPQATIEDELACFCSLGLKSMFEAQKIFKVVLVHSLLDENFSKDLKAALPEKEINPEFAKRLDAFRKKGQIPENFCNMQIMIDLKIKLMSYFLLGKPILGLSASESEEHLVSVTRIYAAGLRKK